MQLPRILTHRRFRPPPPPLSPSPPTNVNDDGPNVNDDGPKRQATAKISGNLWEPRQRHGQHERLALGNAMGMKKRALGNAMGNINNLAI